VELSNPRVEFINGENQYTVDYRFQRGQPKRGALYRFAMVSGSENEYHINCYFNESQLKGSISGAMPFYDAAKETSQQFEARLEIMLGTSGPFKTISNKVSF